MEMFDGPWNASNDEHEVGGEKAVSRRDFLKIAGITGAAIGLGAGLGGVVAACGGDTTTTASGAATTAATTGTTVATTAAPTGATTTVSAGATAGREIKLGFVSPQTGALASFGVPDKYCVERWSEAIGDGLVLGDGQKHPISIAVVDSQSDVARAAAVAGDLINNAKIDMMLVADTPDTVVPVVEQCEAAGVPCVSTDCPWQTYIGDRFKDGYKWSYHIFFGGEDTVAAVTQVCDKLQTNKVLGLVMPNDSDGNYYREQDMKNFPKAGYKMIDGGAYQNGTEDYSAMINTFKSQGVEIMVSVMIPPDFTNFWKQAIQQGWIPKMVYAGKSGLFPQSVTALGSIANGVMTDLWWHPVFPFKSSLTGETCQQLADDFEKRTGEQWTQPLLHYVLAEMAICALANAKDPTSKDSIIEATSVMKLDTVMGPIDFSAPLVTPTGTGNSDFPSGPGHVIKNVYDSGVAVGQWLMQGGTFAFDLVPVGNGANPFLTDDLLKAPKALPVA
jgi:branched-chain amino acid transport system substrate-binding protein